MQYPETRYEDSLAAGISSDALSMTADTSPPTRTQGIITIGRLAAGGGPNVEDVYYNGVAGNVITIGLRGLSQTALTVTSVLGNQKVHNADESLEITTHHNYATDLLRKSEDDTVTGQITFEEEILVPGLLDENGNESVSTPATASAVNYIVARNSATGVDVKLESEGDDTNIGMEIDLKGTGVLIIPDQSETKTNAAPIANEAIANKKYVDDAVSSAILVTTSRQIIQGVLGAAISAGDLSGNTNLLYFDKSAGTWKKVTNTITTHPYQLGLALETGSISDTIDILVEGSYSRAISATQPTFTGSAAGNLNICDTSSNHGRAIRLNNESGAECQMNQLTLSLRQQGAPAGDLYISIVLPQVQGGNSQPACFYDTGVGLIKGAVIATGSISQALFSGTYQDFNVNFTAKIPAGISAFVVLSTTAVNASNYYQLQGSSARSLATATWSGTGSSSTFTLTTTSLASTGVSLKVGAAGNTAGSWGIGGFDGNNWSRVIGTVLDASTIYLNTTSRGQKVDAFNSDALTQASTSNVGYVSRTTQFVPNRALIDIYSINDATADAAHLNLGYTEADSNGLNAQQVQGLTPGVFNGTSVSSGAGLILINGTTSGAPTQNPFYIVRSETGYYAYIGYPGTANFLSVGAAGFAAFYYRYRLTLLQ